jgi:hypothetical protein
VLVIDAATRAELVALRRKALDAMALKMKEAEASNEVSVPVTVIKCS